MLLVMFRDGRIDEVASCVDVVHKEGRLVCLDGRDAVLASFLDEELLYYTQSAQCIDTIRTLKPGSAGDSFGSYQANRRLAESVLERLWRRRKRRQLHLHASNNERP